MNFKGVPFYSVWNGTPTNVFPLLVVLQLQFVKCRPQNRNRSCQSSHLDPYKPTKSQATTAPHHTTPNWTEAHRSHSFIHSYLGGENKSGIWKFIYSARLHPSPLNPQSPNTLTRPWPRVAHPARRRQPPSIKALPVAPNWIYATFMCVGANSQNRAKNQQDNERGTAAIRSVRE